MTETVLIQTQPQEDEIVISLTEHKTITHDTVRINLQVNAQRDDKTDETKFRANILTVLNKFIRAQWRFTAVHRQRGQTRFEQVTVHAVTRVPEAENKQLVERANAASEQGLELVSPTAIYALPTEKVREINRGLRIALAKQAEVECAEYNAIGSRSYRVALIEFADTPRLQASGATAAMYGSVANNTRASNAYAASPGGGGGGVQEPDVEEGAPELGVSERFWVAAQVTLRANRT